ncbi:hypothetical protein Alsa1_CDS0147 [Staphylococcus phage Alsa_1]|nr:hypothetical protein Alsa1_CDS0147 [Staphylococcus phage Alsa_1]
MFLLCPNDSYYITLFLNYFKGFYKLFLFSFFCLYIVETRKAIF